MDRRAVITSLLLAAWIVGGSARADSASAFSPDAQASIKRQLDQAVQRGDTPGVVALVVDRNGILYEAASGKVSTDAIFNIASMTKPVTSVAIMMLLEQGKLTLDDPVSKHLPGFDKLQVFTKFNEDGTYEARPAKKVMTLRHLLAHTSGIGYPFSSPTLARMQQGTNKLEWELPLLHEPGEKWSYGASTRVLGMIVEKITGTSLEAYYQERIFRPLGMKDTSFAVPAEKHSRVASVHRRTEGAIQAQSPAPMPPTSPPVPSRGDGGLYSTARDYGLFVRMFLNGGKLGNARILSERSVKLMGENHIDNIFVELQPIGLPALSKPFPLGAGQDKFGLGFQVTAKNADNEIYRRAGSLSWAGIFNTEFWIDPQQQIGGVLLMQMLPFYDDGAIRTLREFEAAVYRGLR